MTGELAQTHGRSGIAEIIKDAPLVPPTPPSLLWLGGWNISAPHHLSFPFNQEEHSH